MTRKVFQEDPYRTELDTGAMTVDGDEITLDDTICFAFSGGQESTARIDLRLAGVSSAP